MIVGCKMKNTLPTAWKYGVTVVAGALVLAASPLGCGGDGARQFGGESSGTGGGVSDTGGTGDQPGGTGGDAAGTGGVPMPGSGGRNGGATGGGNGGLPGSGGGGGSPNATGGGSGGGGRLGTGGFGAAPASGGTPATGGRIGSGGGGGVVGSGGGLASGGRIGTGATGGGGGIVGTGGVTGTGGILGTGGITGTGGASPADCNAIASAYQTEIPNAKSCAVLVGTCKEPVSASLGCEANCITYVNDPTRLNDIAKQWTKAGCQALNCRPIACVPPTGASCVIGRIALSGMCVDTSASSL
ncbi:MAG: hypothetical protein ABUL77_04950 [Bacteroidota bacterium]